MRRHCIISEQVLKSDQKAGDQARGGRSLLGALSAAAKGSGLLSGARPAGSRRARLGMLAACKTRRKCIEAAPASLMISEEALVCSCSHNKKA